MSPAVVVEPCPPTRAGLLRFLKVAHAVYRDDPHWVAPLNFDMLEVLGPSNPLFQHAEMRLWVARRGSVDVGRIAGILERNHNAVHEQKCIFFGFFECENDGETSRALFQAVFNWARELGMDRVLGPMNPTTNDECGLLIEGFDAPAQIMMTYNPRYYAGLIESQGFLKAKDLLAYAVEVAGSPEERLQRIAGKIRRRNAEFTFRPITKRSLSADLPKIKAVYNAAWEKNWGFVPMTEPEIDYLAARLKPLLVEGLVWMAEVRGEAAGFMLTLPDYNEAILPLRGSLFTPRLLGVLPYLMGWKLPRNCRVVTLGVKAEHRNRGIEAVMLAECLSTCLKLGFQTAEASWVLEDNQLMRRLLEPFGGRVYKTYRLYERVLK